MTRIAAISAVVLVGGAFWGGVAWLLWGTPYPLLRGQYDGGYIGVMPGPDGVESTGTQPLMFTNLGDVPLENVAYWISNADAGLHGGFPSYWEVGCKNGLQTYTQGNTDIGCAVSPGDYLVEINGPDGLYVELLTIRMFQGEVSQSVQVWERESGEKVWSAGRWPIW